MKMKQYILVFIAFLFTINIAAAGPGRWETELSGENWKLWLDREADWKNDDIFLPPFDLRSIPVNPPTIGWEELEKYAGEAVSVPGTVEEYYWGANGNPVGIAGDFRGVSWWSTSFEIDPALRGKRIKIMFDSVNLRAEVFVNRGLVGYDVIGNTPFEIDVTDAVNFGSENTLSVRVTDPVGNFTWEDNDLMRWGKNMVPSVHGFGGVTGKIYLRATDDIHIDDIYVENKPAVKEAEVFVTIGNSSGETRNGSLSYIVHEWKNPSNVVWKKTAPVSVPPEGIAQSQYFKAPKADAWNIRDPHLYTASVTFSSGDDTVSDSADKRFGFRYFDVKMKDGDKRYYLNGKRVFMFAAMTRGFWPKNGMFPTPEMAQRDVDATLMLGFNMMLFHRAIGQHYVTELCDEAGLLVYEEPGGYRCTPEPDASSEIWRREKLRRMIIRDRTYPSVVIYNLKNEARKYPSEDDISNVKMVHELDPGRIVTYNSGRNLQVGHTDRLEKDPNKLHMLPFDDTLYYHGWWDHHHWFSYASYVDDIYNNPEFYMRGTVVWGDSLNRLEKDEIIFWGEEGQWGTMMRLEKIKNELMQTGASGFREQAHLNWFDYYERFLDESGFRKYFPTVDDLNLSMSKKFHYFHGRVLENVRLGNITDGYNLNGWAAPETSEDIVGVYRYPTAEPSILSYYARPLYVAVKIRDKVLPSGTSPVADFFIINEADLKGSHTLEVEFVDPSGTAVFSKEYAVFVKGGEQFGELLVENVVLPAVGDGGYYDLNATLRKGKSVKATGTDNVFAVDLRGGIVPNGVGAVIDTSGVINEFLRETCGFTLPDFDPEAPEPDYIVIGAHDFRKVSAPDQGRYINSVMDRVHNGTTLILLDQSDKWAEMMSNLFRHPAVEYRRRIGWGNDGHLFAGYHKVLEGLPQAQGMNWEYQVFHRGNVWGIDMGRLGPELIVGLACENRKDIVSALSRVPYGNGEIYLNTLNILRELSSDKPQSAVAKKLFLNFFL
jgi:beta-galactosidase